MRESRIRKMMYNIGRRARSADVRHTLARVDGRPGLLNPEGIAPRARRALQSPPLLHSASAYAPGGYLLETCPPVSPGA